MGEIDDLLAEVGDLRHRLSVAESVLAICDLKARYGELVDRRFSKGRIIDTAGLARVADQVAALFAPDGVWDGGPVLGRAVGRDAIAARLRQPTLVFARHFFLNPRISSNGTGATARWDVLSPCRDPEGTSYWMTGYEDDEYTLVEGTWLHQSMRLTTVFMAPVGEGWTQVFT